MSKPLRPKPLARLADADPVWVDTGPGHIEPSRRGIMLSFNCPIHEDCRLAVPVNPAIDGGKPLVEDKPVWTRTGDEDFDTVSLHPSIRIVPYEHDACAWHGWIRDGAFLTCRDAR